MSNDQTEAFRDILATIDERSDREWVYLPAGEDWSLDSRSVTLEGEEVPPELEDDPDAGIPIFAKQNRLMEALPVSTLQDIVSNARAQKPLASIDDLFSAFKFYYDRDAFIEF